MRRLGLELAGVLPGACGAGGFAVIVTGVARSMPGDPGFTPRLNYISELALPHNPMASLLNQGFIVGGVLAAAFLVSLAIRSDDRAVTRAAGFGALGALGLVRVALLYQRLRASGFRPQVRDCRDVIRV